MTMTQNHKLTDDSNGQSDQYSKQFETIEDKAREAVKHGNPGAGCDVSVRAHNRDYDPDRGLTEHLIRTDDEWIAVQTWSPVDDEDPLKVRDTGEHLVLETPDLARKRVFNQLVTGALDAIDDRGGAEQPVKPFTTLIRNGADVAENLITEWEAEAERVVRKRLHEGVAGWTGRTAWTSLEQEAIYVEAERVATQFISEHVDSDVSDAVAATIRDVCEAALFDGVDDQRSSQTPQMDYAAEVILLD